MLDLPSTDRSSQIATGSSVTFLDEYRMMVFTPKSVSEFTLFDTLVPRGHSVSSRRFVVPLRYYDWTPFVFADDNRRSGTLDRDSPLTTDPTQAIFVMRLVSAEGLCNLLIVRIQPLIEHVHSGNTGVYVPWDMWGRSTVVMDVSRRGDSICGPYPLVHVHGTQVVMVKRFTSPGIGRCRHYLYAFDFCRRSPSLLPLCDEGDGVGRRAAFEDGRYILLQEGGEMDKWRFHSLDDGRFMYLVSRPRCQTV